MRLLVVFTCILLPFTHAAQKVWSLEECINYALENNLQIKQAELNGQISEENLLRLKGRMLPSLNGFANHTYNFGQRIDPFTNQFANTRVQSNNFYLNSQVDLFTGFQNKNRLEKGEYDFEFASQQVLKTKNDVALLIARSYLQLLFDQELKKIADEQVLITTQQLDRLNKLVLSGNIAKGDLLSMEAQLANDELNAVNAENNKNISQLNIQQLLQLEEEIDFITEIPEIDENIKTLSSDYVYEQALNVMPEISSEELRIESAKEDLEIALGGRYPMLSLSASAGTGYSGASKEVSSATPFAYVAGYTEGGEEVYAQDFVFEFTTKPFSDQVTDNLNQSIGFNLNIPVFNRFSTKTAINTAKLTIEQAKISLEQAKNQLKNDVQTAHSDMVAAIKKYKATQKSVIALQESFDYSRKKFEVGLIPSVEFNNEKNNLSVAQSDLVRAKYDYLFKSKVLEFYQGKSLIVN